MKSSPVYCIISASGRKSDPSFGSRGFNQDIRVGTSASNSHTLARITVERHENDDGTVSFSLWIDGIRVRHGVLDGRTFDLFAPDIEPVPVVVVQGQRVALATGDAR